ncbi:MAG: DUF2975 domain-containing protein [Clostridiales bacterium]|nr:DUF2975 domain-containing protein [Clostridiales bacterium]
MSSKSLCFWVRCAIGMIAVCGLCVCAAWYPLGTSFSALVASDLAAWCMLAFFWLTSLPCFFILVLSWKISAAIKTGDFFTARVAKLIKSSALILFIDLGAFFIGNLVFALLQVNVWALAYFFLTIAGLVTAIFMSVLSHYVAKAAELRDLNEGTI